MRWSASTAISSGVSGRFQTISIFPRCSWNPGRPAETPGRFRGGHSSRGPLQRRAQRPESRSDLRNQPRCFGSSGGALEERRCRAISLLFFLRHLRQSRRRFGRGDRRHRGDHPLHHLEDRVELEVAKLASDEFSPTFLRNATAYGVSPCHSFDLVLNTSWRGPKPPVAS